MEELETEGALDGASDAVDVIIPTRDRLVLTHEAVASVLAQTHRAWHCYVIDDGSQPDTLAGLRDLCAADQRLHLLTRATSGGPQVARQSGFDAGTSPWVATLDSDDMWEPTRLEIQLRHVRHRRQAGVEIDAILAGYAWIDARGDEVGASPDGPRGKPDSLWLTNNFSTLLVSRSTLASVGGFLPDGQPPLTTCENLELCLRLASIWNLEVLPDRLAHCRVHGHARASDAMKTRAAADELASVLAAQEATLARYPNIWADLEAQTGARYLAAGQLSRGWRLMAQALRRADRRRALRLLRRYGLFCLRAVPVAGRARLSRRVEPRG